MNEVFYELKEVRNQSNLSSDCNIEIILHFLSKVQEFLVLYETKVDLSTFESYKLNKSEDFVSEDFVSELQKIFRKVDPDLSLVKGKIRDIYISRA
jgi:hypothetical protein